MNRQNTKNPYVSVRSSAIHGRGVFAKKDIPKNTRIIEYVGEKITKTEAERRARIPLNRHKKDQNQGAVYLFVLNKRYDVDGHVPYNTARHINHSCDPNSETEIIKGKIWVIALRDIRKGEEITYNYSYEFDGYNEHKCFCRTQKCVGFILAEEHWPRLKKARLNGPKINL